MQTRLFASIAGLLAGLAAASWINTNLNLGLSNIVALVACGLAGGAVGYALSMLFDVFTASSQG